MKGRLIFHFDISQAYMEVKAGRRMYLKFPKGFLVRHNDVWCDGFYTDYNLYGGPTAGFSYKTFRDKQGMHPEIQI